MKPSHLSMSPILPLALAATFGAVYAAPAEAARGFDVRDLQKLDRVSSPTLSLLSAGASCAIAAWAAPISDSADVPTKNLASQCLCEACIP